MKTFNLRTFASVFFISIFSFTFGQSPKEVKKMEDSQFHNSRFDTDDETLTIERRELDYLHAINKIDDILITYSDLGITVVYGANGNIRGIHYWNQTCNNSLDFASFGVPENSLFCSNKSGFELINYGGLYLEMKAHADYLVKKNEVDAYNNGLAWRGPYTGHASGNRINYNSNNMNKIKPGPTRKYKAPNPNYSTKKSYNSTSGGLDPHSRSASTRVGHTLSK